MSKVFDEKIKPILEIVHKICVEEEISYQLKFKPNEDCEYYSSNGKSVFGISDIFTMIQHWEAKHNMPLFPNSEENKNIRKRS
jgi:hypothetical protein